jgi:hypothetical protein
MLDLKGENLGRMIMERARYQTSARDALYPRKLGSQSALVPEGGSVPPTFPPHPNFHKLVCEEYERERVWPRRKTKKLTINS